MQTPLEIIEDFFLKSLQVNQCYEEDWLEMKSVFKKYHLNMNQHGPIITINQLKNIRICDQLTNILSNIPQYTQYQKKELFIVLLRSFPTFTRNIGYSPFENWVLGENPRALHELLSLQGTLKKTDMKYEQIIRQSIQNRTKLKIKIKKMP